LLALPSRKKTKKSIFAIGVAKCMTNSERNSHFVFPMLVRGQASLAYRLVQVVREFDRDLVGESALLAQVTNSVAVVSQIANTVPMAAPCGRSRVNVRS
jgi:hypothetical protein